MKTFWTYLILNKLDRTLYAGKANDLSKRWKDHIKLAKSKAPKLHIDRAMKKHGIENFTLIPYCCYDTEAEALAAEIELILDIRMMQRAPYNKSDGGTGISGYRFTPEQKERSRLAAIARWNDPECREKMIANRIGLKRTTDFCQQQSERAKANWRDPEIRERNSKAIRASQLEPDVVRKKSESMKKTLANRPPRKLTEEERKLRSEAQKRAQNNPETRKKNSESQKRRWAKLKSSSHIRIDQQLESSEI